jgi:hypothetical protein
MTRRTLFGACLFALASLGLPAVARPAEKAGPLEVTYYYLPG